MLQWDLFTQGERILNSRQRNVRASAPPIDNMTGETSTTMAASELTPSLPSCAGFQTGYPPVDMVLGDQLSNTIPHCWVQTQTSLTRLLHWQVSLDNCNIDQIAQEIVKLRNGGANSICKFRKSADDDDEDIDRFFSGLDQALFRLHQDKIRRAEYDNKSAEVLLYIMPESLMHYQVQKGVTDEIGLQLKKWANKKDNNGRSIADVTPVQRRVGRIRDKGTANIKRNGLPWKSPDLSFGPLGAMPSLVGEVS